MELKTKNNKYGRCREYKIAAYEIIILIIFIKALYLGIV